MRMVAKLTAPSLAIAAVPVVMTGAALALICGLLATARVNFLVPPLC